MATVHNFQLNNYLILTCWVLLSFTLFVAIYCIRPMKEIKLIHWYVANLTKNKAKGCQLEVKTVLTESLEKC